VRWLSPAASAEGGRLLRILFVWLGRMPADATIARVLCRPAVSWKAHRSSWQALKDMRVRLIRQADSERRSIRQHETA